MSIEPNPVPGRYKMGTIIETDTDEIEAKLGFPANVKDDPAKVSHSWGFKVAGEECGIWSYRGSEALGCFSYYGPAAVMADLFGAGRVTT